MFLRWKYSCFCFLYFFLLCVKFSSLIVRCSKGKYSTLHLLWKLYTGSGEDMFLLFTSPATHEALYKIIGEAYGERIGIHDPLDDCFHSFTRVNKIVTFWASRMLLIRWQMSPGWAWRLCSLGRSCVSSGCFHPQGWVCRGWNIPCRGGYDGIDTLDLWSAEGEGTHSW